MQAPHEYPAGVQVFEKMRAENYLYIDKTEYVYRLTHQPSSYFFLSRPRRFGKTLLVSTMEAYFLGRRELFKGLAVDSLEQDWERHPVLRFDLSDIKTDDLDELELQLFETVGRYECIYGIRNESPVISSRVSAVINAAYEQTGKQVVVLVDEYDAPILNVLHDPEKSSAFRQYMRKFYSPLKKLEPQLRFVFLTGITKFSQLSLFSELNNLKNISMMPDYAGICGITEDELRNSMGEDVSYLAHRLNLSADETYAALKDKYDGYHFCMPSPDVYNPFSLVSAFDSGMVDSYWFASATPTSLVNMLTSGDIEIPDLEGGIIADATSFDAPTESMASPVAYFYQSGYLTIKDYDETLRLYTLGIPNGEVSEGLYKSLLPAYARSSDQDRYGFIMHFSRSILDDDFDKALQLLRSFFAAIPYDLAPKCEKDFQTVMYVLFKVIGAAIASEVRTATGRIDLLLESPATVYVIELKYDGSAQRALDQINGKDYSIAYAAGDKPVVKAGVNFSAKERTIEEGWIIERA